MDSNDSDEYLVEEEEQEVLVYEEGSFNTEWGYTKIIDDNDAI